MAKKRTPQDPVAVEVPEPTPKPAGPCLIPDCVRTNKLSIVDETGKEVAALQAVAGGAGLWINTPDGGCISIFSVEGQVGIGYYDGAAIKDGKGMTFAVAAGPEGPALQVRSRGGEPFWVSAENLKKLATPA